MTAYRVAVAGRLPTSAMRILSDVGARPLGPPGPTSTLEVVDQAALVGLLNRMHALGLVIERIDRVD